MARFIAEIIGGAGGVLTVLGISGVVIAYFLRNAIDSDIADEILERTVKLVTCGLAFLLIGVIVDNF